MDRSMDFVGNLGESLFLSLYIIFLNFILKIYAVIHLEDRTTAGWGWGGRLLYLLVHSPKTTLARSGLTQRQEPGIPSQSVTRIVNSQVLRTRWIRNKAARTQSGNLTHYITTLTSILLH